VHVFVLQMRLWFHRNSVVGTLTILFALGNPEVLTLLISKAFGSLSRGDKFYAPISQKGEEKLQTVGLYGNFLEDFPQIAIQIVSFRGS